MEPGSLTTPCTYDFYIDGSTYLARNCHTGANDYSGTDAYTVIQTALNNSQNGGTFHFESGLFVLSHRILIASSNMYLEGEGGSASNAAAYASASFQGTILEAGPSFPAGVSLASPTYIVFIGGNTAQLQGGGFIRFTLANSGGFGANNIGGIAVGFALSFIIDQIAFGAFNQGTMTDLGLSGPALTFDATLTSTLGNPTGGWIYITRSKIDEKIGGEEAVRIHSTTVQDVYFDRDEFFSNTFNRGIVDVTQAQSFEFTGCEFDNVGNNGLPAINIHGSVTGFKVLDSSFETTTANQAVGNNEAMITIGVTGDLFVDTEVGLTFQSNTFLIPAPVTTPMKYVYNVTQTTANAAIREFGDMVINNAVNKITFLNDVAGTTNVYFTLPVLTTNTILPSARTQMAGASPWTYKNTDGYAEVTMLTTAAGITQLKYQGVVASISLGIPYILNPGDNETLTWSTSAPTITIQPINDK